MMQALKHPSFLRTSSRPSSPAPVPPDPDPSVNFERAARPYHKLSLTNFRRSSPAPSGLSVNPPVTLVQDGSYLEMLSLRLSEAVSKALAQPTGPAALNELFAGKRPIPSGRGRALGTLIASELRASRNNGHLHRATLRSLHRPLSVLVTTLSTQLMSLISSPSFHILPCQVIPAPNAAQLHALAIADFAGELIEIFDDLVLGLDADPRGDGLKAIRDGLLSLISRVVNPLINGMKNELTPIIEALETPVPNSAARPKVVHPSIVTLQGLIPTYTRLVARCGSLPTTHSTLATFLISLVWKGLVALANRPYQPSPPSSPATLAQNTRRRRGSPTTTPPLTPPAGRFTIKLPSSRPPSPIPLVSDAAAADARSLHEILSVIHRPAADRESTRLAKEAVDEAFDGFKAFATFLEAIHASPNDLQAGTEYELNVLTQDLPTLIALQAMLHAFGGSGGVSVASMLGLDEEVYRRGCLAGFGRAEDCAPVVGQQVLEVLRSTDATSIVVKWLQIELADASESPSQ